MLSSQHEHYSLVGLYRCSYVPLTNSRKLLEFNQFPVRLFLLCSMFMCSNFFAQHGAALLNTDYVSQFHNQYLSQWWPKHFTSNSLETDLFSKTKLLYLVLTYFFCLIRRVSQRLLSLYGFPLRPYSLSLSPLAFHWQVCPFFFCTAVINQYSDLWHLSLSMMLHRGTIWDFSGLKYLFAYTCTFAFVLNAYFIASIALT